MLALGQLSIRQKLIGLIAVMIATIVVFLTIYFSTLQIRRLRQEQTARVAGYGLMLSEQVRSAVAFSDRETAREVLASLNADRDIDAVVLFGADGQELYASGTRPSWSARAAAGVESTKLVSGRDSIAVVAPVTSLEGPRGVLVIQASMNRIHHDQVVVEWTGVAIGSLSLLFGVAAAWWIAGGLTRRVRAIATAASAISAGDHEQKIAVDSTRDEIGMLARAFDHMVGELRSAHLKLEARVAERTSELGAANNQLRDEMERRARVELELRQAQKLESVGRLASGVAHEINTPMQFVNDSVQFIRGAIGDMTGVLAKYKAAVKAVANGDPSEKLVEEAQEAERDADIDFLCESIPEAVGRATDGIARVVTIVRSMKEFAHPDAVEMGPADLNASIESTLVVARNEYKYVAELVTNLAELPAVTCRIGEINQVVLNLVVNAAHAIADATSGQGGGTITVSTRHVADAVEIAITDTGAGIPESIREQIFDPFFTTKEVGRGSGQGLSIARAVVVDKHHGRITFESEVGNGTTFFVTLPVQQPVRADV